MCKYVYMNIYIYLNISLSIYMYMYIYVYVYLSLSIYIYIYMPSTGWASGRARAEPGACAERFEPTIVFVDYVDYV